MVSDTQPELLEYTAAALPDFAVCCSTQVLEHKLRALDAFLLDTADRRRARGFKADGNMLGQAAAPAAAAAAGGGGGRQAADGTLEGAAGRRGCCGRRGKAGEGTTGVLREEELHSVCCKHAV